MRSVLGIDAAWTCKHPSGVALAAKTAAGWELIAVESSYERFQALEPDDPVLKTRSSGSVPNICALLNSCNVRLGRSVDLIAIDMPLSHADITGRRASDNAVSREYSGRKCGTHSPSVSSPGRISDDLTKSFELAGYPLQTIAIAPPGLIEVYPHPALVELANAPELKPKDRLVTLFLQWREIVVLLDSEIRGVAAKLPELELSASGTEIKAYEDALDAVVCAWVAICALDGRAKPFGDDQSAIWIPVFDR